MQQLNLGRRRSSQDKAPLENYRPVNLSARPNFEKDEDEARAGFPLIAVFVVVVTTFAMVSARAGLIVLAIGAGVLVALHFFVYRR